MRLPRKFFCVILAGGGLGLSACGDPPGEQTAVATGVSTSQEFVGRQACVRCHETENRFWTGSHHDLAMDEATSATVLGDFNDVAFTYAGVTSTFTQRDDKYFVRTDGADGNLREYEIAYTSASSLFSST